MAIAPDPQTEILRDNEELRDLIRRWRATPETTADMFPEAAAAIRATARAKEATLYPAVRDADPDRAARVDEAIAQNVRIEGFLSAAERIGPDGIGFTDHAQEAGAGMDGLLVHERRDILPALTGPMSAPALDRLAVRYRAARESEAAVLGHADPRAAGVRERADRWAADGARSRPAPRDPEAERAGARVTVVIATRDRRDELCTTLDHLTTLPERPDVIVVDNASADGTADAVAERFPHVRVLRRDANLGAAARNIGADAAGTPYIAFSDDDSWWAPGALAEAVRVLDTHPTIGVVVARTLVGPEERPDPMNDLLAESPLEGRFGLPGPSVLGFLACGAVVRAEAFRRAGGFARFLMVGGEEQLLAWDLAAAGWDLVHVPSVVAHHHPSPARDQTARRARAARNDVLVRTMRRPLHDAAGAWLKLAAKGLREPYARRGALAALAGAPAALTRRRTLPHRVQHAIDRVDSARTGAAKRRAHV